MSNPHDVYAIAVRKRLVGFLSEQIVGHLPSPESPISLFFMVVGYPVELLTSSIVQGDRNSC